MSSTQSTSGGGSGAGDLAQFNDAEAARNAYFSGSNGDGENSEGENGNGWTDWFRVDRAADWFIYGREHNTDNLVEFHVTGTAPDGRAIFLDTDGTVVENIVVLDNMDQVNAALEAYFQNEEDGNVDEGDQPTGGDPGPGRGGGGGGSGGGSGLPIVNSLPIVGSLGTMGQALVVILIVSAVYYYRNDGDLSALPIVGGQLGGGSA